MNEKEIIFENAIREFKNTIKLPITITYDNTTQLETVNKKIKIELKEFELIYNVEIKKDVNRAIVGQIKLKNKNLQYLNLIVTHYVAKEMADKLKDMEVQFIDTAGNAYLNQFPLYVFIKGNKLKEKYITLRPKRILKPTGLRILYNLLINPELINKNYREIAKATEVALGTIGWFMRDLRELGFLIELGNQKRKLVNDKKVLMDWCLNYPEKLKPKIHLGNYEFINKDAKWTDFKINNALWGGEPAAAKLTNYLRPEILTLYVTKEDMNKVIIDNRLNKTAKGKIRVYDKFWIGAQENNIDTVNPILIYADLLATGNDRNIETANMIYEQNLKHFG